MATITESFNKADSATLGPDLAAAGKFLRSRGTNGGPIYDFPESILPFVRRESG